MNVHNVPAMLRSLPEVVAEYDEKRAAIAEQIATFNDSCTALELAGCVGGSFGGSVWAGRYGSTPSVYESTLEACLLTSAWKHVYAGLNIDRIATAEDRKRFDLAMENPPEFTLDNIGATFGTYVKDPYHHILRGLAECFCALDNAYKSHSKVKIGVAGLPKRIIVSSVGGWGSWGYERVRDTLNALSVYRGGKHLEARELQELLDDAEEHGASYCDGIEIRRFANGNAHLIFESETLRDINRALAEFYGDTLPDSPEEAAKARPGTEVAKNLAYYPTPPEIVERILSRLSIPRGAEILEPQCGCGRFLDGLRKVAPGARATGVEVHGGRASECRAKGHHVLTANFLQVAPDPRFDLVVMNPPFNGREWRKHLDHARRFLKPHRDGDGYGGGVLVSILPASAYYDGHLDDICPKSRWMDHWHDLAVGSFSESGTNIPTGYVTLGPTT